MRILTLSQLSLAGSSGIAEVKVPLWWDDGSNISTGQTANTGANIGDGNGTGSALKLFTLSSNWPATQKFAYEATLYATNIYTCSSQLWDLTSNSAVSGALISTTSTTATIVRSSQVTLTPGHQYGISLFTSSTNQSAYLIDASLIIFPS